MLKCNAVLFYPLFPNVFILTSIREHLQQVPRDNSQVENKNKTARIFTVHICCSMWLILFEKVFVLRNCKTQSLPQTDVDIEVSETFYKSILYPTSLY